MTTVDAHAAARHAKARGAIPHLLDGSTVHSKREMLNAIAAALSFPDYFGHNLDALADALRDLSWLPDGEHVLIWSSPHTLREADPQVYQVIREVLDEADGLTVVLAR